MLHKSKGRIMDKMYSQKNLMIINKVFHTRDCIRVLKFSINVVFETYKRYKFLKRLNALF